MENPLDLKLLMSQTQNSIPTSASLIPTSKTYRCETCHSTYTDKMYYELHRQSHQKEISAINAKDLPLVQIVLPSSQVHPQPAHQQQHQSNTSEIIIHDDQVVSYKRAYGVEPQQVYTLAPLTQYQVISGNSRGGSISLSNAQSNPVNISTYSAPAYVVTATPDGHHFQPIAEAIIQQDVLQNHEGHSSQQQQLQHQTQAINAQVQQIQAIPVSAANHRSVLIGKDRPFRCDQCTASFIDFDELEEHRKKHTGDGPFTCEDCHFTFMYKSHYRSHKTRCQKKRAMNPNPPKQIVINPSPVKRQFPTHQTQHIILNQDTQQQHCTATPVIQTVKYTTTNVSASRVNSVRPTSRQISAQKFNPNNPTFKRQKKESRLDRPYECDECDASFQNDVDLKTHKSKHTGEGPFKCDECKFVFLYRKLYEAHRRRCEKRRKEHEEVCVTTVLPTTQSISSLSHGTAVVSNTSTNNGQVQYLHHPQEIQIQSPSIVALPTSLSSVLPGSLQMHSLSGQPSVIEMRPANSQGHELQQIHVPQQAIIEQVIVGPSTPGTNISGGRHEIKYEMVPAVDIPDGMNVNHIMNLIKVKGESQ